MSRVEPHGSAHSRSVCDKGNDWTAARQTSSPRENKEEEWMCVRVLGEEGGEGEREREKRRAGGEVNGSNLHVF